MGQEDTKPVPNQNRKYGWILIGTSFVLTVAVLAIFDSESSMLVVIMIPGVLGVLALVLK
jgi:hypothetical protein